MRRLLSEAWRLLKGLPLAIFASIIFFAGALVLLLADLFRPRNRDHKGADLPNTRSASVVIPNWNGKDLLEKYLPSVVAAMSGNPANEIIVVDNGSEDGSAAFVR